MDQPRQHVAVTPQFLFPLGVQCDRSVRDDECWTDHRMVRANLSLQLRPAIRKKKAPGSSK